MKAVVMTQEDIEEFHDRVISLSGQDPSGALDDFRKKLRISKKDWHRLVVQIRWGFWSDFRAWVCEQNPFGG